MESIKERVAFDPCEYCNQRQGCQAPCKYHLAYLDAGPDARKKNLDSFLQQQDEIETRQARFRAGDKPTTEPINSPSYSTHQAAPDAGDLSREMWASIDKGGYKRAKARNKPLTVRGSSIC